MLSALIKILKEGIEAEDEFLKTNGLARRLTEFIINNEIIPPEDRILSMMLKGQVPVNLPDYKRTIDRDIRIRQLYLNNIRQYCVADTKAVYYSLCMDGLNNPTSCVFHGANGSGKTTLFASLEYLYLGRSAIAESHGEESDTLSFLRGINHTAFEAEIKANLVNSDVLDNRIDGWEIPAAFCSECDYFELTRSWNTKEDYFAHQLGYGEMSLFLRKLTLLKEWFDKAELLKENKKEIRKQRKTLAKSGVDPLSEQALKLKNTIEVLETESTRLNTEFLQSGGKQYFNDLNAFIKRVSSNPLLLQMKSDLSDLIAFLNHEWQSILKQLEVACIPIITKVVGQSLDGIFESIDLYAKGDTLKFSLMVRSKLNVNDVEDMSPVLYFNTFRLKLFCVALKLGLLCCAKKIHGINIPFVVDDVFDSSDFSNRTRIRSFMREMFKAHDKALLNSSESNPVNIEYPLQMIFFTQDNIIGENVYRGISDVIYDGECSKDIEVKYSRLFSPQYANPVEEKELDYRKCTLGGEKVMTISIEDIQNAGL